MNWLLEAILKKRGIEDVTKLDPAEKEDFDRWNKILTQEKITIENLQEFIREQKEKMENKVADPSIPREERLELLPYLTIYKALLGLIKSPQAEKERTEKYLKQLLNQ